LQKNEAPKHVYIIYNFSNDYYDNVQAWEGVRVPSIMGNKAGTKIVLPENPSILGKLVRYVVWNSRIYSFYSQATISTENHQQFPLQQRWLFSHEPPDESKLGDEATLLSSVEIGRLAKQYGFTLTWIGWRDLPLEQMEELSGDKAINKIITFVGENGIWKKDLHNITLENKDILKWENQWLHPQTRHASAAAVDLIAQEISLTLKSSKCAACIRASRKQ